MKKIICHTVAMILLVGMIASCSKTASNPNSMTASINGAHFAALNVTAQVDSSLGYARHLTVTGTNGAETITLAVFDYLYSAGNYYIYADSTANNCAATYSNGTLPLVADSGAIYINSVSSSTIQGTFRFTTASGLKITNGAWSVKTPY